MDKHAIASILEEIGTLLSLQGENPFKIRAYHNAARAIENTEEDLETLIKENRLQELPGIGTHMLEKVTTLVKTGKLPYYEKLKRSMPKGLLDLLKVPGLGGKRIKILYEQLKITTLKELSAACKTGRIAELPGFGPKSQEKILNSLTKIQTYSSRLLWIEAMELAQPIVREMSQLKEIKRVEIAGSLRRMLETVGDLDFLVATSHPSAVLNWFVKQPWIQSVISKGPSKVSVRIQQNFQADLRIIPETQFASALIYFTGSKEHNVQLRKLALKMGLSLSEYGLIPYVGTRKKAAPKLSKQHLTTEEGIYQVLGLAYIPPELRENQGEIEAAQTGELPVLLQERDIRGAFHCHTSDSDGHNTLEEMVLAAERLKWEYIGISDHSKSSVQANGMNEERLFQQKQRIQKLNRSGKFSTYVFAGLECDILNNGKLDFPDSVLKELDFVIASIHRSFHLDEKTMTVRLLKAIENPYTTIIGHITGRLLLRRDPYPVNLPKVIDACIANDKMIELNCHPMRLDMDWRNWHRAKEKGLKCCINPDAHRTTELEYVRGGVHIARKGWLEKSDVFNALPLTKIKKNLSKR